MYVTPLSTAQPSLPNGVGLEVLCKGHPNSRDF